LCGRCRWFFVGCCEQAHEHIGHANIARFGFHAFLDQIQDAAVTGNNGFAELFVGPFGHVGGPSRCGRSGRRGTGKATTGHPAGHHSTRTAQHAAAWHATAQHPHGRTSAAAAHTGRRPHGHASGRAAHATGRRRCARSARVSRSCGIAATSRRARTAEISATNIHPGGRRSTATTTGRSRRFRFGTTTAGKQRQQSTKGSRCQEGMESTATILVHRLLLRRETEEVQIQAVRLRVWLERCKLEPVLHTAKMRGFRGEIRCQQHAVRARDTIRVGDSR
jgi:hypothetical protein